VTGKQAAYKKFTMQEAEQVQHAAPSSLTCQREVLALGLQCGHVDLRAQLEKVLVPTWVLGCINRSTILLQLRSAWYRL
jgi:hypothetical protein